MSSHGRYVMLRKIADGGMAEIFLAKQTGEEGFARLVIVKRILPPFASDPHFRSMLLDEAHIAMSLNHNNVVPVLDLGRAEGSYFLVMELVDGWDLGQIYDRGLGANFPIPVPLALHVVAEVCRGLGYAHNRKDADGKPLSIVHRDVSPQNILISEQGEVKITDFGIAKALGNRNRTQQGMIKGKLDFLSPEQALGKPIDARSDIFAAGTVLYLLVTGRRPFAGQSDMETLACIQRAQFPHPQEVRADLPRSVSDIIMRAMQVNPADRFRNAEEMMLAIESVLREEFGSPGQSYLKHWLIELQHFDGSQPVSRRPGIDTAPPTASSLTSRWFAEGEMLSFEDSSQISGVGQNVANVSMGGGGGWSRNSVQAFSTRSAMRPGIVGMGQRAPAASATHPRPDLGGGFAPAGGGYAAAGNLAPFPGRPSPAGMGARPAAPLNGRFSRLPTGSGWTSRPSWAGRPSWATRSSLMQLPRNRPFLKALVVLILFGGVGALVVSQVMPEKKQAELAAEARAAVARGRARISGAVAEWRARRTGAVAETPTGVGVDRAAPETPAPKGARARTPKRVKEPAATP